jgi:hypothetical protein
MKCRFCSVAVFAIALCLPAASQVLTPAASASCNPWKLPSFADDLTLRDRICIEFSPLASPILLAESGLMVGVSQWRNSPHMARPDSDDLTLRLANLYARRTARVTAETLVGYLHHEDPRLRFSDEQGGWRRTRAALLNVLESPDQNGNARIALAPIAGAFGSGLTSMALYQRQNSWGYGLERSGIIYSHYLIRSLYHEFSPEIWSLAPHFVRKHHTPDVPANEPRN